MFGEELVRVLRRPRNIVILSFVAVVVPVLLGIVVKINGVHGGGGPPIFAEITQNAVFLPLAALATADQLILPIVCSIVGGDAVAGDAANGSLRYLLIRRTSRLRILNAKALAATLFSLAVVLAMAIVGVAAGLVLFPHGVVVSLSGLVLSFGAGVVRVLAAALLIGVSLLPVVLTGVALSTFTSSSLTATALTLTVTVAALVLDGIPQLAVIHPLLFTNYWGSFLELLRVPVITGPIMKDLLESLVWSGLLYVLAVSNFTQRDVLV
jgi:ABC-2 type transport system permease protein